MRTPGRRILQACILLGLAAGLSTVPARAQAGNDSEVMAYFDKDHDGRLDATELQAAYQALRGQRSSGRRNQNWGVAGRGDRIEQEDVTIYPDTVPLYDPTALRTIFIDFEDWEWEAKMEAFYRTDIEMPATITIDGQVFHGAGVHFRGNSSYSSIPTGFKRSLQISLDYTDEDAEFLDHNKLRLLNANEDPTFLRGILALTVARDYYMAPQANLARVVINGENWGLYMNVEHFNGDLTKPWYGKSDNDARWKVPGSGRGMRGTLYYLGDNIVSYRQVYEIKSDDDPEQWQALIDLTRILARTPPEELEAALDGVLDVDGTLRFLAVDNLLVSNDGFWTKGADYAIYRDGDGVFHLLQHDINEFFLASSGRGGGSTSLSPLYSENDRSKAVAYYLLAVPELKARYLDYVREMSETWLTWDKLGPIVQQYVELIRDDVYRDTKKLFYNEDFTVGVNDRNGFTDPISLRAFVERRRAYLDGFFERLDATP